MNTEPEKFQTRIGIRLSTRRVKRIRRSSAFTLVELLVVVAIISVLMAILTPSIQSARLRAAGTGCTSNLRNIGIAQSQYALDHDGRIAGQYRYNAGGYGCNHCVWDTILLPYLPDTGQGYAREYFFCPAARFAGVEYKETGHLVPMHPWHPRPSTWTRSYGINHPFVTNERPIRYIHLSEIPAPAGTIIIGERNDIHRGQFHWSFSDLQWGNLPGWHSGKDNYLMLAGNVHTLDYLETIGSGSLGNPKGMWTSDPKD